ncbi:MAG: iron-sulfur cluster-binding protein, partial [Thermoplasmata archaeon]
DLAREILANGNFDTVYACGPEKMIVSLLELTRHRRVPMQASLERFMKCGIGICDSCAIDGLHVCRDGPVFSDTILRRFEDLGKTKLDAAGRRISI